MRLFWACSGSRKEGNNMNIELSILDAIQSIRTPMGDVVMPLITKLGNGGIVWVVLAAGLLGGMIVGIAMGYLASRVVYCLWRSGNE